MKRLDPQAFEQNIILSLLSPQTLESLLPYSKHVSFDRGDVLMHTDDRIDHCFFPTNGMISLLAVTPAGNSVEIAYIGSEGLVGFLAVYGKDRMLYDALAQSGSRCIQIDSAAIMDLFERSREFRKAMLRFTYLMIRQFTQTCVCNHFHTIEARVCRWLSVMCERSKSVDLEITQEFIALMLGVQRTSIGPATAKLQRSGLLRYSRGKIEILDHDKLKQLACDCYSIVTEEQHQFKADLVSTSV